MTETPGKLKETREKLGNLCGGERRMPINHSHAFVLYLFPLASAAATLSISPRKVRQINDPILQILNQLHKIIFITQVGEKCSFACKSMHNLMHIIYM